MQVSRDIQRNVKPFSELPGGAVIEDEECALYIVIADAKRGESNAIRLTDGCAYVFNAGTKVVHHEKAACVIGAP